MRQARELLGIHSKQISAERLEEVCGLAMILSRMENAPTQKKNEETPSFYGKNKSMKEALEEALKEPPDLGFHTKFVLDR